jgi:hypothetical protein
MRRASLAIGAILALAAATATGTAASATAITDPAGDFLGSYTGPANGDMDVLGVSATADARTLHLAATLNGALGTTPGALYVFGVDRGTHDPRFGAFQPGVLFDAVVIAQADGSALVRDLISGAATPLDPGEVHVGSDSMALDVPLALLPSEGAGVLRYGINLWPRIGLGRNETISDFAPDDAVFFPSAVPEPATIALLGTAIAGLGLRRRSRARATPA